MAQALFKSWFVDFDPVVVNALRPATLSLTNSPTAPPTTVKTPMPLACPGKSFASFPERFVESELGPIPEAGR